MKDSYEKIKLNKDSCLRHEKLMTDAQCCFKGPRVLEARWVRRFKFVHESPQFVMLSHKHRTLSYRHRSQVVLDSLDSKKHRL